MSCYPLKEPNTYSFKNIGNDQKHDKKEVKERRMTELGRERKILSNRENKKYYKIVTEQNQLFEE